MKLEIVKINKNIDLSEIIKIENKFNIVFPNDYKSFLLKYNGGKTNKVGFKNNDKLIDGPLKIMNFYSLNRVVDFIEEIKKKNEDIEEDSDWEYYWEYYAKENIIIIADTYSQVFICIGCNKNNFGKIYYKEHDHGEEFVLLANNFTEFLEGFEFLEEEK